MENKNASAPLKKNILSIPEYISQRRSPLAIFLIASFVIFLVELLIMFILDRILAFPPFGEAVLDAVALSVIVLPVLYLLFYMPLADNFSRLCEAEEELRLFRSLIDRLNDSLFIIDPDTGDLLDFNETACAVLGYSRDELIGMKVIDFDAVTTSLDAWEEHVELLKDEGALVLESEHRRKDGAVFPVEINVKRVTANGREYMVAAARDITARKLVERELNRFKTTLDMTLDSVFMFDPETLRFVYVNEGAVNQVGYTREELLNMTPVDIKPEFTEPIFRQMIVSLIEGGAPSHIFETVHRRKDGTLVPVEIFLQYIVPPGEKGRFLAIVRDVTEHKRAEEKLRKARDEMEERVRERTAELVDMNNVLQREVVEKEKARAKLMESEKRFREMLEKIALVAVFLDMEGNITFCNDFLLNLTGWARDEVIGGNWFDIFVPIERKDISKQAFMETLALYDIPAHYESEIVARDGERYLIWWNSTLLRDVQNNVIGISNIGKDITERQRAEESLRQAHAETEQLLAALPSVLIGVDDRYRVTKWNPSAEKILGLRVEDVIGKKFSECGIKWNWDEISRHISDCHRLSRAIRADDVPYIRVDGKDGFLGLTFTPIFSDSTAWGGFLVLGADITERKILESQLAQAQKLESIGQLAAGIAHEINTPTQYVGDNIRFFKDAYVDLNELMGKYSRLLEAVRSGAAPEELVEDVDKTADEIDIEYLSEEIPKAIEQSLGGVERVASIVRAMKEFSHPGTEEKTAVDINKAIESTITVARNEWKYVSDMETDLDPALPLVPVLPGDFNQVILNLIVNAAHAISDVVKGGAEGKGLIRITTRRVDDLAEIRVADTGGGIPEKIGHKVFDPFFTTKGVGKGTGQGLAISRNVIVDKHGGEIFFETEQGEGTTFIIRLPLEDATKQEETDEQ